MKFFFHRCKNVTCFGRNFWPVFCGDMGVRAKTDNNRRWWFFCTSNYFPHFICWIFFSFFVGFLFGNSSDDVHCGPITCPLNLTSMCFFTSRVTQDSRNGSYITNCGTCLSFNGMIIFVCFLIAYFTVSILFILNTISLLIFIQLEWINSFVYLIRTGSTVKDSCYTEPTLLKNLTNPLAISITNSSINQARMRNAMSALLMSEMATSGGGPSIGPSVSFTTPPSPYYSQQSQQPIIVVQPPAQQIYFNGPYGSGLSRPIRSPDPSKFS